MVAISASTFLSDRYGDDYEHYIRSLVFACVQAFEQARPEEIDELRRLFAPLVELATMNRGT